MKRFPTEPARIAAHHLPALVALAALACGGAPVKPLPPKSAKAAAVEPRRFQYPPAPRGNVVDTYHGTQVADPYRWLEDPDAPETRKWIEAQNQLTQGFLASTPARATTHARLTELWNYERFSAPAQYMGRYFYARNDGLQNQSVLWMTRGRTGEPEKILDPNTLSEDGTTALKQAAVSRNGKLLAYQLSKAGSDWAEIRVRDIDKGRDVGEVLRWVKFSDISWRKDSSGFFYSRYDAPQPDQQLRQVNLFQKLYFHKVGTPQAFDKLVYQRGDHADWGFGGTVSEDDRWLIIGVWRGAEAKNQVFVQDLAGKQTNVFELVEGFDHAYDFVGNDGSRLWFRTDNGAPRGRVIEIDLHRPTQKNWREVVAERAETLRDVRLVGDRLICSYLKDARSEVRLYRVDGSFERELALPGLGTVSGFSGQRRDRETFFLFTSFTFPTTVYRYDFNRSGIEVFKRPEVAFHPEDYETKQVFFPSKDGTRIPMFLVHKKGLKLDGNNPVYLHSYGGFDVALTPTFKVDRLVWLEQGGVFAMPNLRGGGEYGEAWHKAGMLANKQNVFDDFIAAAEWLIAQRYTRSSRLAIGGGSNGGLLVGACMTQRPELFGAVLAAVGVMDMLRFHKWTIGWAWVPEYGTSDRAADFDWLYAYSPYHNLKPAQYPATLVTTADHDDRVVPAHSFKFAAALQHAQQGPAPTLIRIETKAGHGAGKPTGKRIDEAADRHAFLMAALGMQPSP